MRPHISIAVGVVLALGVLASCTDETAIAPSTLRPSFGETGGGCTKDCIINGRMTGGGGSVTVGGVYVTKGLTLHCDITLSNNLEINWAGANNWHLTKPIETADCVDDPAIHPEPPVAPFDTFNGTATGSLNGVDGSFCRFTFVDAGEPGGKNDKAGIQIWAPGADPNADAPVLNLALSPTKNGNLQAHYDQPHK